MDKLNRLLSGSVLDFAAAFDAATSGPRESAERTELSLRLEGWVVPARGGFLVGEGEFRYQDRTHRFHFSSRGVQGLAGNGTITRLQRLSDFNGTYLPYHLVPTRTELHVGVPLINEHGVLMMLRTPVQGRPFHHPSEGLTARLTPTP
jgi:hypothetical protein